MDVATDLDWRLHRLRLMVYMPPRLCMDTSTDLRLMVWDASTDLDEHLHRLKTDGMDVSTIPMELFIFVFYFYINPQLSP